MNTRLVLAYSLFLLGLVGVAPSASAAPVAGPEINPFACQGDADAAQDDRSIGQVKNELKKKLDPPFEQDDEPTVRAKKWCVIARLKARVGSGDARTYYDKAIETNPDEPGYDMFLGEYYAGARGAKGQVVELAEKYFYRALEKLDALRAAGRYRDFHAIVEDHVRKDLLVLYQTDGLPLLPWKAFRQHPSGYQAPSVAVSDLFYVSRDTRAELGGNDTGGFTAEAGLYKVRANRPTIGLNETRQIARQPFRISNETWVNLRQNRIGEISLFYMTLHAPKAAITHFDNPFLLNDIDVQGYGAEYKRVIPLYPAFDFKIQARVSEIHRTGVVEFNPTCRQDFPVYEFKPALSRFVSSDKVTLSGTYVYMDIPDATCGAHPTPQTAYLYKRGRAITAINFEYAIYSPLLLPSIGLGSLRPYRTPTRGLYLNAGYVNDNEVFGDVRVISQTFFAGARLEGPGAFDIGLTEIYSQASGTRINPDTLITEANSDISGKFLRSSLTVSRRLINPDETPGLPNSWGPFANHSLNWVFPVSFDKTLNGFNQYENVRAGTQFWWQVFGTGLWGSTLLTTVGYDFEYFYHINRPMHNVFLTARLGWRDL